MKRNGVRTISMGQNYVLVIRQFLRPCWSWQIESKIHKALHKSFWIHDVSIVKKLRDQQVIMAMTVIGLAISETCLDFKLKMISPN